MIYLLFFSDSRPYQLSERKSLRFGTHFTLYEYLQQIVTHPTVMLVAVVEC
jgi:hypothetical protein